MDFEQLRQEFPVLDGRAYLNTGTNGPVAARCAAAATEQLSRELNGGRSGPEYRARLTELETDLRNRLAALLGASPGEIALTRSTTDGVETVLRGFRFERGDEILTSDQEHAGLLGPLAGARVRHGVEIVRAPFEHIAEHVGPRTRLIAVSHVSWVTGKVAAVEKLAATDPPLLLDGAQGLGAIPVDVRGLGCDFYAGSGQKWLCGPSASGVLYVEQPWVERLGVPGPRYATLDERADPLNIVARPAAARFDAGEMPGPTLAWLNTSLDLLARTGWERIHERAVAGTAALRERLAAKVETVPGGPTTLVSFAVAGDPSLHARRLDEAGVVVRSVPGRPWLRASFGAWNHDADVERLVGAL